jgi:hypothetical protein
MIFAGSRRAPLPPVSRDDSTSQCVERRYDELLLACSILKVLSPLAQQPLYETET